jgi:hypothetical protein
VNPDCAQMKTVAAWHGLEADQPLQRRLQNVDKCIDFLHQNSIGNQALTRIWNAVKDMLTVVKSDSGLTDDDASVIRRAAFRVMCACAATQSDRLGMLRYVFVSTIHKHSNNEDGIWRLQVMPLLRNLHVEVNVYFCRQSTVSLMEGKISAFLHKR